MTRTVSLRNVSTFLSAALLMVSSPMMAGERYIHQGETLRAPGSLEALSSARPGEPQAIAKDFVSQRTTDLGLVAGDVGEAEVSYTSHSKSSGVSHVYLQQQLAGIPVLGAILNINVAADGRVVSLGNRFMPGLGSSVNDATPSITALQAADAAVGHLELGVQPAFAARTAKPDARRHTVLNDGGISAGDVPVQLIWYPRAAHDVRLAWHVELEITETANWWQIYVDAHTGEVLGKDDLVVHDTFGELPAGEKARRVNQAAAKAEAPAQVSSPAYEVFAMPAEYPYENNDPTNGGDDVPAGDPDGGRSVVVDPADATASPFGWHDTDGTAGAEFTTPQGNNAHAYIDADANNVPDAGEPDGGAGLDFTGALVALDLINDSPADYKPAAAVNLFYWNNIIHDVFYHYGFDEASGNFQENNYGNGGSGSDYVFAEAQDGSGVNNANFGTPADGSNPRMQMFTWNTTTPNRDGDFSSGIIAHEYGHGISNRLTGGGSNVNCLNNSEQMGEGWSDWLGLVLTANAGDSRTTVRGLGTYALGESPDTGGGIRPAPYTTDMGTNGFTYGDTTSGLSVPHGIGFTWSTIIWEAYWDLVDEYGFNPDFYQDWTTGGNNLAIQLVIDGMKLQACSPGFVDGRDGILQADVNLTGGANQCLLWKAFARRGLGESANQNSSGSNSDNVEAFDVPVACDFLGATPDTVSVCAGTDAVYDITVGAAFETSVLMSTLTPPAGTTSGFDPNPVMTIPGSTELTLGSTGGLAAGTYDFNVRGDDKATQFDLPVSLEVFDQSPGAVTLSTPTDGAQDQTVNPTLTWTAAAGGGTYNVQVATDAAFSNIVDSATDLVGTSYVVQTGLNTATTYYWRVQAVNPCGTESYTSEFSFVTAVAPGDCPIGVAPMEAFSEDFETGAAGWTTPGGGVGANTWASVGDRVHSGVASFHAADPAAISDQYLVSPSVALPAGQTPTTMRFWTYQEIEDSGTGCFDGGVVEISTDGTNWTRLESEIVVTPYDGPVSGSFSNPIAGQNAWCGDPRDWTQTVVEVDAWAGQNVQFRFRMTSDSSVDHPGWWVDDVTVQSCLASDLFADGFESGDVSAWASSVP